MTHAPGPWRVHSEHADRIIVNGCCVYQVGNLAVPDSYEPDVLGAPNADDVRLMAAAPSLLAELKACKRLLSEIVDGRDHVARAWLAAGKVIDHAEGRSDA